tara:strand:- start:2655 stop:3473 length:819 start_codon:yes stop_codon:yes gene_type:complete
MNSDPRNTFETDQARDGIERSDEIRDGRDASDGELERLRQAERFRTQFYSVLHHELKTPLTSIRAALDMLLGPELSATHNTMVTRLLNNMGRSTSRLERLISDLLDVAIAQGDDLPIFRGPVDISNVIHQVVTELTPTADSKGVFIAGGWRGGDGPMVTGDEIRLQQIMANLLSNAIKASPDRGPVLIDIAEVSANAEISVANRGEPLDQELKDRLFEPFQKSAAGGYRAGTGLGLSVVNSLVAAHDGRIDLDDSGGQVKFTIVIPLWRGQN